MNATHKITWYYGKTELCRVIKNHTSLIEGTAQLTGSMLIETHEGQRWISFGLWNAVKIERVWREVQEPQAQRDREMVLIRWNGQSRPVYGFRDEENLPSWMRTEVVR